VIKQDRRSTTLDDSSAHSTQRIFRVGIDRPRSFRDDTQRRYQVTFARLVLAWTMTPARVDNARQRHQASENSGQTRATATTRDHRSENKHGRRMTSSNAVIVPLTLPSRVVACPLLLVGCRVFAACSPPAAIVVDWVGGPVCRVWDVSGALLLGGGQVAQAPTCPPAP
jgi:hypothetical protein